MERRLYESTEKQGRRWAQVGIDPRANMPTDDEFRARWSKSHHGVTRGWGLGKRDYILSNLTLTREYQMGIWQGRVDALNGLNYQTPLSDDDGENTNCYNLGYYRGYTEFGNLAREMGAAYAAFVQKYQN